MYVYVHNIKNVVAFNYNVLFSESTYYVIFGIGMWIVNLRTMTGP